MADAAAAAHAIRMHERTITYELKYTLIIIQICYHSCCILYRIVYLKYDLSMVIVVYRWLCKSTYDLVVNSREKCCVWVCKRDSNAS